MARRIPDRDAQKRIIAIVLAGAAACAALIAGLAHSFSKSGSRIVDTAVLTSGSGFGLSGTVGDLTPGIASRLVLTVTNRLSQEIKVRSVTITVERVPAGCPVANLSVDGAKFTGSPPAVTITGLNGKVPARATAKLPLRMRLARGAANGCQHARFPLRYSGAAITGRLGTATATRLASFPNPSVAGRRVTLIATVTATFPDRPGLAGQVTFRLCTEPRQLPPGSPASACRRSARLGRRMVRRRHARAVLVVRNLRRGSHSIFARFRPARRGLGASASVTIIQRVISARLDVKSATRRGARR